MEEKEEGRMPFSDLQSLAGTVGHHPSSLPNWRLSSGNFLAGWYGPWGSCSGRTGARGQNCWAQGPGWAPLRTGHRWSHLHRYGTTRRMGQPRGSAREAGAGTAEGHSGLPCQQLGRLEGPSHGLSECSDTPSPSGVCLGTSGAHSALGEIRQIVKYRKPGHVSLPPIYQPHNHTGISLSWQM